jgi:hypothetical protein
MAIEIELFESPDLTLLYFFFFGLMKGAVYERNVGTQNKLLPRILDAAARINEKRRSTQTKNTRSSHTIFKVH